MTMRTFGLGDRSSAPVKSDTATIAIVVRKAGRSPRMALFLQRKQAVRTGVFSKMTAMKTKMTLSSPHRRTLSGCTRGRIGPAGHSRHCAGFGVAGGANSPGGERCGGGATAVRRFRKSNFGGPSVPAGRAGREATRSRSIRVLVNAFRVQKVAAVPADGSLLY